MKYIKRWNLWHLLGSHKYKNCVEYNDYGLGGETKFEYSSPWLFGVCYNRYQCLDCGMTFWMPKGNFESAKANEIFLDLLWKR